MNVFILGTGRCGTHTFAKACGHMTNFTAGHQSRDGMHPEVRFDYPPDHVEADMRLSWFLGQLDERFGDEAYYVHLHRNPDQVAQSLAKRWHGVGHIAPVYRDTIVGNSGVGRVEASRALVNTMLANIEMFLKDKSNVMRIALEKAPADFPKFWDWIGAEGDLDAAMAEWNIRHGASLKPVHLALRSIKARTGKAFRAAFPR